MDPVNELVARFAIECARMIVQLAKKKLEDKHEKRKPEKRV